MSPITRPVTHLRGRPKVVSFINLNRSANRIMRMPLKSALPVVLPVIMALAANKTLQAQLSASISSSPQDGGGTIQVVQDPNGKAQPVDSAEKEPLVQNIRGVQTNFPETLLIAPPTEEAKATADRFVEQTIDPELPLNLVVGRPKVLQLSAIPKRLYVPNDDIVRTEVIDQQSGKEIAVTGLQVGSTTLILWFDDPNSPSGQTTVSYLIRVFADPILAKPIESLEAELNTQFPNSSIKLDQIEDRMIVRGQAPDTIEMSQILQVLMGSRGGNQISLNTGRLQSVEQTTLTEAANFKDPLTQSLVEDATAQSRRILDPLALARAGIINQMTVVGEQQVMLKVTVAEVNRSAARSIGLNFGVQNNSGFTVFNSLVGNPTGLTGTNNNRANILASLDMGQVTLAIEALRRLNLSKTLAEPNLVTLNGQTADFQAGGRFPVPTISAGGNGVGQNLQGVAFIPFGVDLEFTPTIRDRDVITLRLNAEVSTRDESLGTAIGGGGNGTQVSGLNSRNFSTTVQLRSGQTIAVAGLLQTNFGTSSDRVPFWGDLPIIGATGGVNRTSGGEQELVILVTPHLVAPADNPNSFALPGEDVYEPTDIEFYVANRLESRRTRGYRASVRTDHARMKVGEKSRSDRYMIGNVGPTNRFSPDGAAKPHAPVKPLDSATHQLQPPVIVAERVELPKN